MKHRRFETFKLRSVPRVVQENVKKDQPSVPLFDILYLERFEILQFSNPDFHLLNFIMDVFFF